MRQSSFKACVIVGPTAVGKTGLAHSLADAFLNEGIGVELVNLDAFQIYKGFTIGTAKPSADEVARYFYRGIDVCEPSENLDANVFAIRLRQFCSEIFKRGKIPICVGGSGLYLRAFLHGLDNLPERNVELRDFFRLCAESWGWPTLHKWLTQVDSQRANELHKNDKTRIERALEIFFQSGKPMSSQTSQSLPLHEQPTLFNAYVIHVEQNDDAALKTRIEKRARTLVENGWIDEVRELFTTYGETLENLPAMRAIGYKEVFEFIKAGEPQGAKDDLVSRISQLTWQYARRQNTWNAKEVCHLRYEEGAVPFTKVHTMVKSFFNEDMK